MRILKISLQNLNSLRGSFTIDFTDKAYLRSGIFAIVGPTGAGKSTILDAMCLALYSKTPRLNEVGGSSNEMLTRAEAACMAAVTFEAGSKIYEARFEQHKARNKVEGALQGKRHTLALMGADLKSGEILSEGREVPLKVAEISGLDFDKFTKAMLLAQGNFANFLKSSENERAELLEKLTGTAFYSQISAFIYRRHKEEQDKYQLIEHDLAAIEILDPEKLSELTAGLKASETQSAALEKTIGKLNESIGRCREQQAAARALAELEKEQQILNKRREDFAPQEQRLAYHQRAVIFSGDFEHLQSERVKTASQKKTFEDYQAQTDKLKTQEEQALSQSAAAQKALAALKAEEQDFNNLAPEVRAQDERIALAQKALAAAQQEQEARDQAFAAAKAQAEAAGKNYQAAFKAQESAQNYLAAHAQDADLEAQLAALKLLASDLKDLAGELGKRRAACTAADEDLAKAQAAHAAAQAESKKALQTAAEKEQSLNAAREALAELLQGSELETQQAKAQEAALLLQHGTKLSNTYTALSSTQEKQRQQRAQLEKTQAELTAVSEQIAELKPKLERAQLEASHQEEICRLKEKVMAFEEQRALLKPSTPCPLCGSLEHPYVDEELKWTDAEAAALEALKEKVHDLAAKLETARQREASLSLAQEILSKAVSDLETERQAEEEAYSEALELLEKALAAAEPQLEALLTGFKQAPSLEILKALTVELEALEKERKELATAALKLKKKEESAQQALTKAQAAAQSLSQEESALKVELTSREGLSAKAQQSLQESLAAQTERLTKLNEQLGAAKAPALTADDPKLASQIKKTLAALEKRAHSFADEEKNLSKAQALCLKYAGEQQIAQQKADSCKIEAAQAQTAVSSQETQLATLKAKRRELFGEKSLNTVREDLQSRLKLAQESGREAAEALEQIRQSLSSVKGAQILASETLNNLEVELAEAQQSLLSRLQGAGFASLEDFAAALLPKAEAEALAAALKALSEEDLKLRSLLEKQRQTVMELSVRLKPGENEEAVSAALTQANADLKALSETKGSLNSELARHQSNLARYQAKEQELEAQAQTCRKIGSLNALIGTADGKSYRKFVQGISLEFLIQEANRELKKLSERYELAVSEDVRRPLEIDVIDLYQFSSRRPTSNLSGGETFLVSLALALGLSRMASAEVKVGSLFLDEGFGTLDDEALEAALDALSSLQQEGKLIGIISHVGKLKERILTQIEVKPLLGGYAVVKGPGVTSN